MTKDEELIEREYRKTATIRATQWHKMGDHPAVKPIGEALGGTNPGQGWIDTLEGGHIVTPGDWIATGVKGEHWPIKPDVFAASYVPVSADRLEALAQPVVGVDKHEKALETLALQLESSGTEHDLARAKMVWRRNDGPVFSTGEVVDAMLAFAALAATPSPVVGDREAIARVVADYQHAHGLTWDEACEDGNGIADAILSLSTPVVGGDAKLLDALKDESWDLRCFDIPTGGGDADIGWRVIGHYEAEPHERVLTEIDHNDPRAALRAAMQKVG